MVNYKKYAGLIQIAKPPVKSNSTLNRPSKLSIFFDLNRLYLFIDYISIINACPVSQTYSNKKSVSISLKKVSLKHFFDLNSNLYSGKLQASKIYI